MSIYDREYIRVGPHSKSGLGSLRFISFNSWIIIINVAVFLVDVLLAGAGQTSPVLVAQQIGVADVPSTVLVGPIVNGGARALPARGMPPNTQATQVILDPKTHDQIGLNTYAYMTPLQKYGHLSTYYGIKGLQMWRYLTFQFLHANLSHIFFNMFGLWVFGGMVEQYLGSKRYAAFYLTCGIFGAMSYLLLNLLGLGLHRHIPGLISDDVHTPLVGASAGVFGVIMACAYIAPKAIVQLLFPPIPIPLWLMAYGYVALAAWNLLRGGNNAGGDAAHMGGAVAGFFFIRNAHLLRDFFDVLGNSRGKPSAGIPGTIDVDAAEVDRILGKVARDGLASLSESERRTLRRASGRRG
jgi:membrane associated rhomboid family serine protease